MTDNLRLFYGNVTSLLPFGQLKCFLKKKYATSLLYLAIWQESFFGHLAPFFFALQSRIMQGEKSTCGRRSVSQGEEGPSPAGRKRKGYRLTPMIEREKRKREEGIAAASAAKKDENFSRFDPTTSKHGGASWKSEKSE